MSSTIQELLPVWHIKIDGSHVSEDLMFHIIETTVEDSLHLPSVATIVLVDPQLRWIDEPSLKPGAALEITAGDKHNSSSLFKGEIVEIEPHIALESRLTIRAFDKLHRLARGRHARSFVNVSDGDLVRKCAQDVGLSVQSGSTPEVHPYVLQSNQTNLEFLQSRAARLGFLVYVRGDKIHFEAPTATGTPIELSRETNLIEFRPRLSTVDQVSEVHVRGWDPARKQEIVGQAKTGELVPAIGQSTDGGKVAQTAHNVTAQGLITNRPIRTQTAADALAKANSGRRLSRFIEAEGTCVGDPRLRAGTSVKISNVGNRYKGTYFVTSVTHVYEYSGHTTEFNVTGQDPATVLSLLAPDEDNSPITGPVIGIVSGNNDPEGHGRVKVTFPWLDSVLETDWIRIIAPGAGASRGMQFLPEVHDEVLVDFEMGDINFPYVLGGLWNGKDAPPKANSAVVAAGKVTQRIIKSRSGHIITLDDSDSSPGITIEDNKGNKIVLDTQTNALTVDVKGNATVKAQGNVDVKAGINLTLEATASMKIKGAMVSIEASGITEIKGSLVKLN